MPPKKGKKGTPASGKKPGAKNGTPAAKENPVTPASEKGSKEKAPAAEAAAAEAAEIQPVSPTNDPDGFTRRAAEAAGVTLPEAGVFVDNGPRFYESDKVMSKAEIEAAEKKAEFDVKKKTKEAHLTLTL